MINQKLQNEILNIFMPLKYWTKDIILIIFDYCTPCYKKINLGLSLTDGKIITVIKLNNDSVACGMNNGNVYMLNITNKTIEHKFRPFVDTLYRDDIPISALCKINDELLMCGSQRNSNIILYNYVKKRINRRIILKGAKSNVLSFALTNNWLFVNLTDDKAYKININNWSQNNVNINSYIKLFSINNKLIICNDGQTIMLVDENIKQTVVGCYSFFNIESFNNYLLIFHHNNSKKELMDTHDDFNKKLSIINVEENKTIDSFEINTNLNGFKKIKYLDNNYIAIVSDKKILIYCLKTKLFIQTIEQLNCIELINMDNKFVTFGNEINVYC